MRVVKMLVLTAALLVLVGAASQALADGWGYGGGHGDDLTVCCKSPNFPEFTGAAPAVRSGGPQPQVLGCKAIGSDADSINRCRGVVLGCSETAFVCYPSQDSKGKMDCLCLRPLLTAN